MRVAILCRAVFGLFALVVLYINASALPPELGQVKEALDILLPSLGMPIQGLHPVPVLVNIVGIAWVTYNCIRISLDSKNRVLVAGELASVMWLLRSVVATPDVSHIQVIFSVPLLSGVAFFVITRIETVSRGFPRLRAHTRL